MRILVTVSTYFPSFNGVQFVTAYLAEGLSKCGHLVDVITYATEKTDVLEEEVNGVHIVRWEAATAHMFHKGDKAEYQKYILEKQEEYDVLFQVGTQTALTDWVLPIIDKIKIPKVLHIHSVWNFHINKCDVSSIKRFILKIVGNFRWGCYFLRNRRRFRAYDKILQLHEEDYSVEFMRRLCGKESIILHNAVDERFFKEGKKKESHTIVYVANYSDMKNQKAALTVFEQADIPNDWKLILIGSKENAYVNELRSIAEPLVKEKNRQIEILVGLTREETIQYVRNADIYLMTSRREAFPISILEAMAASVPFISTDVGIVKYLPGGIVTDDIRLQIKSLEKLTQDVDQRVKIGEEGYQYAVNNSTINSKVQQLEHILQDILMEKTR